MVRTRALAAMMVAGMLAGAPGDAGASGSEPGPLRIDTADGPFVIFAPTPPKPEAIAHYDLPHGADDYHGLFRSWAPWLEAAGHVDVFAVPSWFVRHYATDDELRTLIAALEERGIALGLEMEPLTWPGPEVCDHTEGFEGPWDLEMAQKLKDLGGTVRLVSLDEPYANAHKLSGPGACRYPVEQVADEVRDFIRQLRSIFPEVVVGSIEPLVTHPPMGPDDFAVWLDTFEERAGEPFAFINVDVDWRREDWPETVREIEAIADARGVPFGILYYGDEQAGTNEEYLAAVADHAFVFEQLADGTPDVVGFYSWHEQLDRVLPDDDTDAFTGRINQYFGTRTRLEEPAVEDGMLSGRLTGANGAPLGGRELLVSADPLGGGVARHRLSGTVPAGVRRALIGVRANVEGGRPSPVDVRISDVSYREGGNGRNRVPNPRFARGLDSWGAYGSGRVTVERRAGRPAMRIQARPSQPVYVDTEPFKVTPGATFDLAATIETPGRSLGSGYLAVMFIGDDEVGRESLWFTTLPLELPAVTTDEGGAYRVPLRKLPPGRYGVEVTYPGDVDHWTARAHADVRLE